MEKKKSSKFCQNPAFLSKKFTAKVTRAKENFQLFFKLLSGFFFKIFKKL